MASAALLAIGKMNATGAPLMGHDQRMARSKMVAGSAGYLVIDRALASGKMKGNTPRRHSYGQRFVHSRGHAATLDWARNSPTVQQPET